MTETEKNKKAVGNSEDWAIIPFDEAEDEARWKKLIEETDKLIEETEHLEAAHGEILMENDLSRYKIEPAQPEEDTADDVPF